MPIFTFYLNKEASESIQVAHGNNLKNLVISQNNQIIGQVEAKAELKEGRSFVLPDGRVLSVQLKGKWSIQPELEILLDGVPLAGSNTDPQQRLKNVMHVFYYLIAINIGLGLVAELTKLDVLVNLGLGLESIIMGFIYLLLAYLVKAKLSVVALYVAIGSLVLDGILTVVLAADMTRNPTMGLFLKIFMVLILLKGVPAVKKLKSYRKLAEAEYDYV